MLMSKWPLCKFHLVITFWKIIRRLIASIAKSRASCLICAYVDELPAYENLTGMFIFENPTYVLKLPARISS